MEEVCDGLRDGSGLLAHAVGEINRDLKALSAPASAGSVREDVAFFAYTHGDIGEVMGK